MDYVWDAFYAVGLTGSPSLASVPIFPKQCQRDLYQHYEVDPEIIGEGSFGSIRRVKSKRPAPGTTTTSDSGREHKSSIDAIYDCYYACKTIPKSKLHDRELLLREVYNLNRCQGRIATTEKNDSSTKDNNNNNYVIRLLDVLEDRWSVHLVTELCQGGELFDYIRQEHARTGRGLRGKALSPSSSLAEARWDGDETRCATIVRQILTAFCFVHEEARVCHRDAKASNFVFVQTPSYVAGSLTLRIIDFGLSKFVGTVHEEREYRKSFLEQQHKDKKMMDESGKSNVDGFGKESQPSLALWNAIKPSYFFEKSADTSVGSTKDDDDDDDDEKTVEHEEDDCGDASGASDENLYSKDYRYMTSEVGTPYYVAPEVLKQQEKRNYNQSLSTTKTDDDDDIPNTDTVGYTSKCDIWSVGVLAFLTLTGTLPVIGNDEEETVQKLLDPNLEIDFSDQLLWEQDVITEVIDTNNAGKKAPKISKSAMTFCKALLQRDPTKRPTAREALRFDWITKHCGESDLATGKTTTVDTLPNHRQSSCLPSLSSTVLRDNERGNF